ncbi:hypothetical protein MRX96_005252 [Rhipicephalus microplus]
MSSTGFESRLLPSTERARWPRRPCRPASPALGGSWTQPVTVPADGGAFVAVSGLSPERPWTEAKAPVSRLAGETCRKVKGWLKASWRARRQRRSGHCFVDFEREWPFDVLLIMAIGRFGPERAVATRAPCQVAAQLPFRPTEPTRRARTR